MDQINLNEIGMREKIKEEVERIKKFQSSILNEKSEIKINNIDIRNYAKYILRDGKVEEKRGLLRCLRSKIVIRNKQVSLNKD
jgi:hypothetical protein